MQLDNPSDPHAACKIFSAGPPPETSNGTIIMLHGRGGSAQGMLGLYDDLGVGAVASIIPQAKDNTWYPHSFLAPIEQNQPYLESALQRVEWLVSDLLARGVPPQRLIIFGFSQGACLAVEYAARHPRQYGAVMALSGGLIGPPGSLTSYAGKLSNTPVFLGACDPDLHVPFSRVQETETALIQMGAKVEMRRYPDMPHSVNSDEVAVCRRILKQITSKPSRAN